MEDQAPKRQLLLVMHDQRQAQGVVPYFVKRNWEVTIATSSRDAIQKMVAHQIKFIALSVDVKGAQVEKMYKFFTQAFKASCVTLSEGMSSSSNSRAKKLNPEHYVLAPLGARGIFNVFEDIIAQQNPQRFEDQDPNSEVGESDGSGENYWNVAKKEQEELTLKNAEKAEHDFEGEDYWSQEGLAEGEGAAYESLIDEILIEEEEESSPVEVDPALDKQIEDFLGGRSQPIQKIGKDQLEKEAKEEKKLNVAVESFLGLEKKKVPKASKKEEKKPIQKRHQEATAEQSEYGEEVEQIASLLRNKVIQELDSEGEDLLEVTQKMLAYFLEPEENVEVVEAVLNVKELALIPIVVDHISGYLTIAIGNGYKPELSVIEEMREKIQSLILEKFPEKQVHLSSPLAVSIEVEQFQEFVQKHADFMISGVIDDKQVVAAFVSDQGQLSQLEESPDEDKSAVDIRNIVPELPVNFPGYIFLKKNNHFLKYVDVNRYLTLKQINRMLSNEIDNIHIHKSDIDKFREYMAKACLQEKISPYREKLISQKSKKKAS